MNLSFFTNIISIFNFRDNSLFLQNWRERTRSSIVISVTIVVTLIVGLLLTNAIIMLSYTILLIIDNNIRLFIYNTLIC